MSAAISDITTISPAGLLLAARLAGYRAVADEVRIDQVDVEYQPCLGRAGSGRIGAYIERDSTAAAVATVELASDQRESVSGNVSVPYVLHWRPQEPADREFHLLNPGSTALGQFIFLGTAIFDANTAVNNYVAFIKRVHVRMTIRGRP